MTCQLNKKRVIKNITTANLSLFAYSLIMLIVSGKMYNLNGCYPYKIIIVITLERDKGSNKSYYKSGASWMKSLQSGLVVLVGRLTC